MLPGQDNHMPQQRLMGIEQLQKMGKLKKLGEKYLLLPLHTSQISHGISQNLAQGSALKIHHLTTLAMADPITDIIHT